MEYGLGRMAGSSFIDASQAEVLILVLMEYGL